MSHPLLDVEQIEQASDAYLKLVGSIFTVFGQPIQDSGNISYGVRIDGEPYFVKTAGAEADPFPKPNSLQHPERVALLRNAVCLNQGFDHPALPRLHNVVESPDGPMLIYEWAEGELIRTEAARRTDPRSALQRFRSLPVSEIVSVLDTIYELHDQLVQSGWIAVDFYDGCLIYDFEHKQISVVDLDHYSLGPFKNPLGRMFGSSRFMAPEEFMLGELVDERTTLFTMGRTAAVLLSDNTLARSAFRGNDAQYGVMVRACQPGRNQRFESIADFYAAWQNACCDGRDAEWGRGNHFLA